MAERVLVAGMFAAQRPLLEIRSILEEMAQLTQSAGGEVAGSLFQRRRSPDSRTLMGRGKVREIAARVQEESLDLVVFFNSLSRIQQRNLESELGCRVIDRTRLILDVFAMRARSLEGKLQVELAQLTYMLPRLTGRGVELSRLGGGIGTRGPGETKLESDRRRIRDRIGVVRRRLDKVIRDRDVQRRARAQRPVPLVSLVGYTSAGKSTLFRRLTGEQVIVSQRLFSTLDPLLRRVDLPDIQPGCFFLLSDTVGFIRDMPAELFRSFRATLEEVVHADILLNIMNGAAHDSDFQEHEVLRVLDEIGVSRDRVINVVNKIDLLAGSACESQRKDGLRVSARTGAGVDQLRREIFDRWFADMERYTLSIPRVDFNMTALEKWALVLERRDLGTSVEVTLLCRPEKMLQYKDSLEGGQP
ncbi:MAG TPA: GTPase HflX [Candidatus Aminicenantes bacterium]|nr:GTPase HflX [Candidatus Aminicenantes bacterium]